MSELYNAVAAQVNDIIQQAKSVIVPVPEGQSTIIKPEVKDLPWMVLAKREIGVAEVPGEGNNPRVIWYHSFCTLKATYDSISWCSAFANAMTLSGGVGGTRSAAALDWINKHYGLELKYAMYGCLSIWDWGNGHGHVGFVLESDDDKGLYILGGNQLNRKTGKDEVCCKWFPWSLAPVSFKWPKDFPLPEGAEVDNG